MDQQAKNWWQRHELAGNIIFWGGLILIGYCAESVFHGTPKKPLYRVAPRTMAPRFEPAGYVSAPNGPPPSMGNGSSSTGQVEPYTGLSDAEKQCIGMQAAPMLHHEYRAHPYDTKPYERDSRGYATGR